MLSFYYNMLTLCYYNKEQLQDIYRSNTSKIGEIIIIHNNIRPHKINDLFNYEKAKNTLFENIKHQSKIV